MSAPRKYFFIGILLMILAATVSAQNASTNNQLTLKDAVRVALERNPTILAANDILDGARSQVKQAKSMYLPRLDFKETFTNGNNPVYVFGTLLTQRSFTADNFNIKSLNEPDPLNNFKSEFTVYQSIWEGGRIRARNRMARLNQQIKEKDLDLARQNLIFNVVQHYFAIQLSRESLKTAQSALHSTESSAERIKNMFDNGMVVRSDLLRIQVYLADVKQSRLEAENHLQLSKAALGADLGQSPGMIFEPATPLKKLVVYLPDEDEFFNQALKNRPEILSLETAIEIARNQIRQARADYYPGIGFFSTLEYNKGTQSGASGGNYILGVQLRLNLFDGFYKGAKVAEMRSKESELNNIFQNLTHMISLQIKDNYLKMRTASQQYEVAAGAVSSAEEGLKIMKNRYDAGLTTLTDLLTSETALAGSRTNLSMAAYQYNLAYANLELAAGVLNINSQLFQ